MYSHESKDRLWPMVAHCVRIFPITLLPAQDRSQLRMMLLSDCKRSWQHLAFLFALLISSFISVDACECARGSVSVPYCHSATDRSRVCASDFIVNQPGSSTTWKNGSPYPVSWTMGLVDGIVTFDIEITRLSRGGVYFVAKER